MEIWINRDEALEILGVKPQSLYAYVSRGQVEMLPDPADSRRSLYRRSDIVNLVGRRSRGRRREQIAAGAVHWGEPAILTSISTIDRERLIYRGVDAVELSEKAGLEDAATLLWKLERPVTFDGNESGGADSPFVTLSRLADEALPMFGRGRSGIFADAGLAVSRLVTAFGGVSGPGPVHSRLAQGWAAGKRATDLIRRALVLLADHELNPSAFAVRVAASTGASVPAALLAGLATLSGPRHGLASQQLLSLVKRAEVEGAANVIEQLLAEGRKVPGFGHPLYPNGDPRAAAILGKLAPDASMKRFLEAGRRIIGEEPDVDLALAALVRSEGLPDDAGYRLFAIARAVGWAAHAVEQVESGMLIRPRGKYQE